MKVGDIHSTSEGRKFINTVLIPRLTERLVEGDSVLFVGTETNWDYKPFFFNPSLLCDYKTLDISERFNPDIVGSIEECPLIPDNSINFLVLIGVYEFVNRKAEMFKEIFRILKPNGFALLSLPGIGYYKSPDNAVEPWEVFEKIKPLFAKEVYIIGERSDARPTSIHVVATK